MMGASKREAKHCDIVKWQDHIPGCVCYIRNKKSGLKYKGISLPHGNIHMKSERSNKIIQIHISNAEQFIIKMYKLNDVDLTDKIIDYFTKSCLNPWLFELGFLKIFSEEHEFFYDRFIMPKIDKISVEEYAARFHRFKTKMELTDFVFTFHTNSLLSKFIAWLDRGTWSHVGLVTTNKYIRDVGPGGMKQYPANNLFSQDTRIGLYRVCQPLSLEQKTAIDTYGMAAMAHVKGYGYGKAIWLALKCLFGFYPTDGLKTTPNGLIYSGQLKLIEFV